MHNNDKVTTTASEGRKSSKPIMEKRRRARINASLSELKSLLLEVIKKEGACHNKMEKADILEMAVKHLRHIQRQQITGETSSEQTIANKYRLGFHACAQEVSKYLGSNSDEDVELKAKLLNHLANCMTDSSLQSSSGIPSASFLPSSSSTSVPIPLSPLSMRSTSPSSSTLSPEERHETASEARHLSTSTSAKLDLSSFGIKDGRLQAISSAQVLDSRTGPATEMQPVDLLNKSLHPTLSMLSQTEQTASLQASVAVKPPSAADDNGRNININSEGQNGNPVSEINNNTISVPTFINVGGQPTITSLQRQLQSQLDQQQFPAHQIPNQSPPQQPQAIFQDANGGLIANMNRLQLIPTKTVNGDIAFVLSTNILNTAQFPSYTIPILAQPAVNQTQVLAPPPQQPAIQIALSYPQEDHRSPVVYLPPFSEPDAPPSNYNLQNVTSTAETTPTTQQAAPLNLSSTNHKPTSPKIQTQHFTPTPNTTFLPDPTTQLPYQRLATSSVPPPTCLNLTKNSETSKSIPFHAPLPVNSHALPPLLVSHSSTLETPISPPASFTKPQPAQMYLPKPDFIQARISTESEDQHSKNLEVQSAYPGSNLDVARRSDSGKMFSTRRQSNFFRPW